MGSIPASEDPIVLAIIGGGIAGLCLTLGILNQAPHIQVHIYESASQFSEIGAGVAFGINAQRALWKLDPRLGEAYAKLRTSNVDFNLQRTVDGGEAVEGKARKETYLRLVMGIDHASNSEFKAGKEVCAVFCDGGFSSVHRARFLDEMVSLIPERVRRICVTFGARIISVEDIDNGNAPKALKLSFANGETATADAVVACDGIKSQMRRVLLGEDSKAAHPVFTGKYAYRGLIPMDTAVAALGDISARNAHHRVGYGGHVLTFPIDWGRTMNVVAFRTQLDGIWEEDADWIKPATKAEMHSDFSGWGDEVHSILDMMERCDKWAIFDHPPASTYHREGRICLIGDAAHGSSPHHGSGAGMAVEDALLMSGLLGDVRQKEELECVFETFEKMRKDRTQKLVTSSREQAALYDFQAPGIEDDVLKIAKVIPRRWDWIWDHDFDEELKEAKALMQQLLEERRMSL